MRTRRLRMASGVVLLVAGSAVGVNLGLTSPVGAATCSPHCYGIARMYRTTHGGTEDMDVTCLSVSDWTSQFVDEEFWVHTGATSSSDWVEEGMTYGTPKSGRAWFWADSRPNGGGYHEHYPSHSASLNTTYISTITYAGSNNWNVYEHGGTALGTSTANNSSSPYLTVGEEITDTTAKGAAVHSSLWYKDTSDTFHQGWPGSTIYASDSPPTASWISSTNSMRAYSNCAAPSIVAAPPATATSSPSQDAILTAARGLAARYGLGTSPTGMAYLATTRSAAARVLTGSDVVAGNSPATVLVLSGNFAATGGHPAAGQAARTGKYLSAVYDNATGELTSVSLTNRQPNVTALGTLVTVYSSSGKASPGLLNSILAAARNLAKQNGVSRPSDIRYVQSSRASANRVDGNATVDTNPSVVAVTLHGQFVGHLAKVPPGQALPTGSYLTAVYDSSTGELTDWSITPAAPALGTLGTVTAVR